MTSQRQIRQDRYDHILPFIQESADEYYGGNLDRGFRHWAFATRFAAEHDIADNEIVDCTAIDGSDDFEIDGYFIPESDDDSVVHIFQSKHRQPGTPMGPGELAKFLHAPRRILSPNEVAASRNEETKALHDHLVKLVGAGEGPCSINLVWATTGRLTESARTTEKENRSISIIVEIRGNPVEVTVLLECLDLDDLYDLYVAQTESDDRTAKSDVEFQLEPRTYHETATEYRTVSMTIPVGQVIDVFARHKYQDLSEEPSWAFGQ